jgi:hypothetical protein
MPFQERSAILREIGTELDAGALAYVTGDRENLETEVSTDVLRRTHATWRRPGSRTGLRSCSTRSAVPPTPEAVWEANLQHVKAALEGENP